MTSLQHANRCEGSWRKPILCSSIAALMAGLASAALAVEPGDDPPALSFENRDWVRPDPDPELQTIEELDDGVDLRGITNSSSQFEGDKTELYAVGDPIVVDVDGTPTPQSTILVSVDGGEDWAPLCRLEFSQNILFDVAHYGDTVVATGATGVVAVSPTVSLSPPPECGVPDSFPTTFTGILYGVASSTNFEDPDTLTSPDTTGGTFIAGGDNFEIFRSQNPGASWARVFPGPGDIAPGQGFVSGVAFANTVTENADEELEENRTFVAVGQFVVPGNGRAGAILYNQDDGTIEDWELASGNFEALNAVAAREGEDGKVVAVGANGSIYTSALGVSWSQVDPDDVPTSTDLNGVHYDDKKSLWVAVGNGGVILTSPDAMSWTQEAPEGGDPTEADLLAVSSVDSNDRNGDGTEVPDGPRVVAVGRSSDYDDDGEDIDLATVIRSDSDGFTLNKVDSEDPVDLELLESVNVCLDYTITLVNIGNRELTEIELVDTLPVELTLDPDGEGNVCDTDTSPICEQDEDDEQRIDCAVEEGLDVGEGLAGDEAIVISTFFPAGEPVLVSFIENLVEVTTDEIDGATTEVTFIDVGDREFDVSKRAGCSTCGVPAGGVVEFIITLDLDKGLTGSFTVTDTYPTETTFVDAEPAPDEGNNVWKIDLDGEDDSREIRVGLRVKDGVDGGTIVTNRVDAVLDDCATEDEACTDTAIASVVVDEPVVDLRLTKVDNVDPVRAGDPVIYTIEYLNSFETSDAASTQCRLIESYPDGWTFLQADPSPDNPEDGNNEWDLGTLNRGARGTVQVTLLSPEDGQGQTATNVVSLVCFEDATTATEATTVAGTVPQPPCFDWNGDGEYTRDDLRGAFDECRETGGEQCLAGVFRTILECGPPE
jgi:hypothetical protein